MSAMRDRLIVGLDVPTLQVAETVVSELGDAVSFYKIGYQLAFAGGLGFARDLAAEGKAVFLDMKLLDIDNTVSKAVEAIAGMGVAMLTLHAYPRTMRAAAKAAQGSGLRLLAVTVLTSMDRADLDEAGYDRDPRDLVRRRAGQAQEAGLGGIVCSAEEAALVRGLVGQDMAVVTPGIRLVGADRDDQKRVLTPEAAIRAGASHLVVGRPIVAADDRRAAVEGFVRSMQTA